MNNKKKYSTNDINEMLKKMQAMQKRIDELEARNGTLERRCANFIEAGADALEVIENMQKIADENYRQCQKRIDELEMFKEHVFNGDPSFEESWNDR